ncbi:MAG: hypothetical protein AB4057_20620 [Crocosphaera sp.]
MTNNGFRVNRGLKTISQLKPSKYEAQDHETYDKMRQLTLSYSTEGLIKSQKCLIRSGQLGLDSACSIINPGVLYKDNQFLMLCRGEPDATVWFGDFLERQATPLWCTLDNNFNVKTNYALTYSEIPANSRPEDWRLFEYKGKIYTNHSIYTLLDREQWIIRSRPGIGEINLDKKTLELRCILEPPFEPSREEKNWSFFVHEGVLMCIYSFNPYIILEVDLEKGTTHKILEENLSYQWYDKKKFVGNSANVVSWDDEHYITFVHDFLEPKHEQRNRAYMQYGVLISKKTLLPTNIIPRPLVMGGDEPGRHPGVHYTSSLINREDGLYGFYGQGDTHIGLVVFNKSPLNQLFAQYPVYSQNNTSLGVCRGIDPRKGIIVSFPRNGLNWVRYCLEQLTGLRTAGRLKLIEDGDLGVYRTHHVLESDMADSCYCPFYNSDGKPLHQKVVLIIRDYRESFLRMTKNKQDTTPTAEQIKDGDIFHFRDYFNNLKAYDEFQGEKLLVYYPNLVSDFSEMLKILEFLGLSYDLNNFDLEYHRQQSLDLYDIQHKSYTKDNLYDFTFHQSQVKADVVQAIDDFVDKNYRDLAQKYLQL